MSRQTVSSVFPIDTLLVVTVLTLGLSVLAEPVERSRSEWSQWRGPSRDGRVGGPAWPDDLSGLEERWRVELGPGYSGPVLGGDRVFVVETVGEARERVRALDRESGKELWEVSWEGAMKVPFYAASAGSWIRATPAWDGKRLFVAGMREVLVALDGATGRELWRVDFPKRHGTTMGDFGFVCSPLVAGEHVYVEAAESLIKLDSATGGEVWRSEVHGGGSAYQSGGFSSPVIATLAGHRQMVLQTREDLRGFDLTTGEILWKHPVPSFRGMNILTPLVWDDRIFTSTYRNASYLFQVSHTEDGGWSVAERWNLPPKAYMSSPVLLDGHVYLHLGNGRLTAIDLEAGESRWTTEPMGKYWSMALQGDKVLALSSDGELHLLRADPKQFHHLASREVAASPTWSYLAVGDREIYVRSIDGLRAFGWRETSGKRRFPEAAAR